jgi:hypothetical protein
VPPDLTHKHYARLKRPARDIYSSLLRTFINSRKKFYNIGPTRGGLLTTFVILFYFRSYCLPFPQPSPTCIYKLDRLCQFSQLLHTYFQAICPTMEHHALKIINKCRNIKISFYLETFGGQSFNLYLNAVLFFSTPDYIRHLWQFKTIIFLHRYLMHSILLYKEIVWRTFDERNFMRCDP